MDKTKKNNLPYKVPVALNNHAKMPRILTLSKIKQIANFIDAA